MHSAPILSVVTALQLSLHFRLVGAASAVCALTISGSANAQLKYQTVALSGQPAPGMPPGVIYASFDLAVPVVSNSGNIAFSSLVTGTGVTSVNNSAIYAGASDAPQLVARTGAPAHGLSPGVSYSEFLNTPNLNDAGELTYGAILAGSGVTSTNDTAIYGGSVAAPLLIAREGDAVPGIGAIFGILPSTPAISDASHTAFVAHVIGLGVTSVNDRAILAGPLASPQVAVREGDPALGMPPGVSYGDLITPPRINDSSQMAYRASLVGSGVTSSNDTGLFLGTIGAAQLIAREGDPAPSLPAGVNFSEFAPFTTLSLNDTGQVAFGAELVGSGVTSANSRATYVGSPGALHLIAREGNAAPDTAAGVTYKGVGLPATNDLSAVAYLASLAGSGISSANDEVIYAGPMDAPRLIAREGEPAPGTPPGMLYSQPISTVAINDLGQVAYLARLAVGGAGSTVQGLFVFDPTMGTLLVARQGAQFDVGDGILRTISAVNIGFVAGKSDDERTGLSSDGTLAFGLVFDDGARGIFTAVVVPEPHPLSMLLVTFLAAKTLPGPRAAR